MLPVSGSGGIVRRKFAGVLCVATLGAALIVGDGITHAPAAFAAPTTQLVGGSTLVAVADAARLITHTASVSKGIVAPGADTISMALAAAAASRSGATLIVSASTTDPAAVNTIVQQKGITELTFVGKTSVFTSSYRNAIRASVTTKKTALSNSVLERSKKLIPSGEDSFVFASTTEIPSVQVALASSQATDSALVLVDGSEPDGAVRSLMSNVADPTTLVVGNSGVADEIDEDDADKFGALSLANEAAVDASFDAVLQQMIDRKAAAATKVVAAPSNDLGSFAIASLVARKQGAVLVAAGKNTAIGSASAANRYVKLLQSEMSNLTLVGKALTTAQLAAVAQPSSATRTGAPAWTITSAVLGSGNYTLKWTARSGASSYKALNYDGSVVGTSSSTSMTLGGSPDLMTIAAYDSAGTELERMYFRSNSYTSAAERPTAIFGTIRGGTADVRILGPSGVPRKIVRYMKDPYADLSVDPPAPQTVAITCKNSFIDTDLNPRVQWTYEVVNLTLKTGSGCGASAGASMSGTSLPVAAIQLPLTEDPWAQPGAQSRESGEDFAQPRVEPDGTALLPRVGQTITDAAREKMAYEKALADSGLTDPQDAPSDVSENAMTTDEISAQAARAPGSGFEFSYQAYIPEKFVPGPTFSGDVSRPVVLFNGSNRSWWDVNNPHTKFDMRAFVGGDTVGTTKFMGQTERWHCTLAFNPDCQVAAAKTASLDELNVWGGASGGVTTIHFVANATNPLQSFAPAINGDLQLELTDRSWTLSGTHDRMPVHQFWWAPFYSEGTLAYTSSDFYSLQCLFGGWGCVANVNVRL